MDMQTLLALFPTLGDDASRAYEVALTRLCDSNSEQVLSPLLFQILEDTTAPLDVRYAAFYCLVILNRHNLNSTFLRDLFRKYELEFHGKKSLNHLILTAVLIRADEEFAQYMNLAYESSQQAPDNAGYPHLFADLFATMMENSKNPAENRRQMEQWYDKALEAVNRAIFVGGGYAKYYCTKGRILALAHRYDDATVEILRAIDTEPSDRSDYSIRIGQYQYHRIQIQADKQIFELSQGGQKLEREVTAQLETLKSSLMSNVEIIAFFAGIISFIIGSLTLASGQTAREACVLIMALLGCLMSAFSALGLILHIGNLSRRRVIPLVVVFAIGAAFLLGGLALV